MEIRQSEHLCRKECQKCPPLPDPPQKTLRSGSKTGQTELFKNTPVFPIDISDLAIPLSAKSIKNLYKPHHCGFMEKSQEYGMT